MADLDTLIARRERLAEVRANGLSGYEINNRSLKYKSDSELAAAIAEIDRQIASLNSKPVRRIVVGTTKGF